MVEVAFMNLMSNEPIGLTMNTATVPRKITRAEWAQSVPDAFHTLFTKMVHQSDWQRTEQRRLAELYGNHPMSPSTTTWLEAVPAAVRPPLSSVTTTVVPNAP